MMCFTIERFLCYWTLDVGGFVLGWLTAIGFFGTFCLLGTLASLGWFLGGVIQPSEDMWHQLYLMLKTNWYFFAYLFYCFLMAVAGIQLIRGTRNRNHNHMKMFLLLVLIGAVASPIFITLAIANVPVVTIVVTSIVVVHVYAFICILSLHEKVKRSSAYETL